MASTTTGENSVVLSLTELVKLEESRVREEDIERRRSKEAEERVAHARIQEARNREAAAIARDDEDRAERARQAERERVRQEAREQAAVEVAKIEAAGRVRILEESAARDHELAVLRARSASSARVRERGLVVALILALAGATALGVTTARASQRLADENVQLRRTQSALAEERDHARANELSALDRRHLGLRARALGEDSENARATAAAARSAIDTAALDHDRVRAFRDALDALQTRVDVSEKVVLLDGRSADLASWAAERPRTLIAAARSAAKRAHGKDAGESEVVAYARALDGVREALETASRSSGGHASRGTDVAAARPTCTNAGDPLCGLNGKAL